MNTIHLSNVNQGYLMGIENKKLLFNPYRQLEAWFLKQVTSLEYGLLCLSYFEKVVKKMLEYDTLNKQEHPFSLYQTDPYNFWSEYILEEYIYSRLERLKSKIRYKSNHPEQVIDFRCDMAVFFPRLFSERQHLFDAAWPKKLTEKESLNVSLEHLYALDDISEDAYYSYIDIARILEIIHDGKGKSNSEPQYIFERYNYFLSTLDIFQEPNCYPNFFIDDKAYKVDDEIPYSGLWLPHKHNYRMRQYTDILQWEDSIYGEEASNDPRTFHLVTISTNDNGVIYGKSEYGLAEYTEQDDLDIMAPLGSIRVDTTWRYVKVVLPNSVGIPDNPLRLADLRKPLSVPQNSSGIFGGNPAPKTGYWWCPANGQKKHFQINEILPSGVNTSYKFVWYFRDDQIDSNKPESYSEVVERFAKKHKTYYLSRLKNLEFDLALNF